MIQIFITLKCTIQSFLVYSRILQSSALSNFRTFSSSSWKETLYPLAVTSHFPSPTPKQSLIYFLSLLICHFWKFHTNRTIQHVVFCDWLHSRSVMVSRFIPGVARLSNSFSQADSIPGLDRPHSVSRSSVDGPLVVFPLGILCIMLLGTVLCKFLWKLKFLYLLDM